MPLHPQFVALAAQMPKSPPPRETGAAPFRKRIDAAMEMAPKFDVPLKSIEDRTIATDPPLKVRVYTPNVSGTPPLLVYYHGGGFVIGDLNIADRLCRAIAHQVGCVLVSVDYRLAPEHPFPVPIDDSWRALLWCRAHAAALGADPSRIAIGGDSAGGNITAALALRARDADIPLRAQAMLYPCPDYPDPKLPSFQQFGEGPLMTLDDALWYWEQFLPNRAADAHKPDAAPLRASNHKGLAPALVTTGECDPARDPGEQYAETLRAAGNQLFFRRYEGLPHGFYSYVGILPVVEEPMHDLAHWLRERFA
jgi:acetyl esterase